MRRRAIQGTVVPFSIRVFYKDGHTHYSRNTVLTENSVEKCLELLKESFKQDIEDSKVLGDEYFHGGVVKVKIISIAQTKVNVVIE